MQLRLNQNFAGPESFSRPFSGPLSGSLSGSLSGPLSEHSQSFLKAVKGGFSFHPTNEDLPAETSKKEKPLERGLSFCTKSENPVAPENT